MFEIQNEGAILPEICKEKWSAKMFEATDPREPVSVFLGMPNGYYSYVVVLVVLSTRVFRF